MLYPQSVADDATRPPDVNLQPVMYDREGYSDKSKELLLQADADYQRKCLCQQSVGVDRGQQQHAVDRPANATASGSDRITQFRSCERRVVCLCGGGGGNNNSGGNNNMQNKII